MQFWQTSIEISAGVLEVHLFHFLRCSASSHCMISFGTWKVKQKGMRKKQSSLFI